MRSRKHILFCFAGLMTLGCTSCTQIDKVATMVDLDSRARVARNLVEQGDLDLAVLESEIIVKRAAGKPPADEALYILGLVAARNADSQQEVAEARRYFEQLLHEFPESEQREEAKIWAGVLETLEKRTAAAEAPVKVIKVEAETKRAKKEEDFHSRLRLGERLLKEGDFEGALKVNEAALAKAGKNPPADAALFNMGLIEAHYANPQKDYRQAARYFERLTAQFPDSLLLEEARIWLDVLGVIEKTRQIDIEIEERRRELTGP